jgi:hypothetical protein
VANIGLALFIHSLKKLHGRIFEREEDSGLFCPATFARLEEKCVDLTKVCYANGIWLEIGAGGVAHRDMARVFPNLRIIAFNGFHSTKAKPQVRVFIPTSRSITADEYECLTNQIVQLVKDDCYEASRAGGKRKHWKVHGINEWKLHAASLFYLPCQPRDPKGRIWKEYKGNGRAALDVDDWLENAVAVETRVPAVRT